ncbi:hypothetical protein [Cupriavidus pinatubonensis]|uniref:Transmembrane protein n=1 Tax=Cupriavidus pinatubonensis TaxID=248026 RepID=A0ABN7ZG47_9BURK|nr:hypothetical protein [Cupriavidus pinatubonensis]CAG9183250.1 hypothetical protein LMG23994_05097 [Cupriavidus pinatubonensis]
MNIAFPAVFLFLLVLPGFLFRLFSQRREVRTFDHTPFSAIALQALLCAAFMNLVVALVATHRFGYQIEIGDVVRLLVGGPNSLKDVASGLTWLNAHPVAPLAYFASTSGLALVSALMWRLLVERRGLDRRGKWSAQWVRGDAPWYYLFSGLDHPNAQEVDGAVVAAVVEFKEEGSYLYHGVMLDYEVNEDGELDRLLLVQAQRRKLASDRSYDSETGQYKEDSTRFYPIAGDVFVLRYDEIKTMNVTYLSLNSPAA